MIIYTVSLSYYDGDELLGVFTERRKAQRFANKELKRHDYIFVEEWNSTLGKKIRICGSGSYGNKMKWVRNQQQA